MTYYMMTDEGKWAMIGAPVKGGAMKRLLPSVLIIFLILLLEACSTLISPISPAVGTAVAQTQTASMWTPSVTPMNDPNEAKIVEWLNRKLSEADPLERTLDAHYQALDASFLSNPSAPTIFRVDMRCECPYNAQCCVPERMFVIAIKAMKEYKDDILEQAPGSVTDLHLVCYNHQTPIGTMVARWADVISYFNDDITGDQFGWRVYKISAP